MDRRSKCLFLCLISIILLAGFWSAAMAQTGLPRFIHTWDILVEDFEDFEYPYYQGWMPAELIYGYGIGYATIFKAVFDTLKQSKVLDVYPPRSVFLLGTPYEKHSKIYDLTTPPSADVPHTTDGIRMGTNGIISFDLRVPLGRASGGL